MNNDFMEVMINAYARDPNPNGKFDKITESMLVCISNLAAESDLMREKILYSPVMNIIYDSTHEQRPTVLIYCILRTLRRMPTTLYAQSYPLF